MIVDMIVYILREFVLGSLSLLPVLDATIPGDIVAQFFVIVSTVSYFLPMSDLYIMFGIWFALQNFSIIWALLCKIREWLPIV